MKTIDNLASLVTFLEGRVWRAKPTKDLDGASINTFRDIFDFFKDTTSGKFDISFDPVEYMTWLFEGIDRPHCQPERGSANVTEFLGVFIAALVEGEGIVSLDEFLMVVCEILALGKNGLRRKGRKLVSGRRFEKRYGVRVRVGLSGRQCPRRQAS